jgi:tetratricopeptide (TPR) repeat protein
MQMIEEIKAKFRNGNQAEALQECEQLCRSQPANVALKKLFATMHGLAGNYQASAGVLREILAAHGDDADAIFNLAVCEREQRNFAAAQDCYALYTRKFPKQWEGWANLAECQFQLGELQASLKSADVALKLNPAAAPAWLARGDTLHGLKQIDEAMKSYRKANVGGKNVVAWTKQGVILNELNRHQEAIDCFGKALQLAPELLAARTGRADALNCLGRSDEAIDDYKAVLAAKPDEEEVLKKISVCLVGRQRGAEAIQLCRNALAVNPSLLTAKLGMSWLIDKIVPNWHVPMMNEFERNNAYFLGMQAAVTPGQLVFEIGAGSGLLSMMAAKLGAQQVVTCEGAPLIADMARQIVATNGYQDTISVLAKPSFEVMLGSDLPEQADILVHEIFSSGLIEEHVLPAMEDAKQRLLKPGARIIPGAASIMVALVGGDDLGRVLHVKDPFGFDLRQFNAITPKKLPMFREDIELELLSDDVAAFRFDFVNDSQYPAEQKTLELTATGAGLCYGVIQWIGLEMDSQTNYQNHPSVKRAVSGWQHLVYRFDEPIQLTPGQRVRIFAAHDRATPWFDLAAD